MAFAALGAADVLAFDPRHQGARCLLRDAVIAIGQPATDPAWPWTEGRLSYANAALAEALIAAGEVLGEPEVRASGLGMLGWLLDRETLDGHLSPTPVGGSGVDDCGHGFDQQPIEIAAIADACARAFSATGDARWAQAIDLAAGWFAGDNDSATVMWDAASGGGFDGLEVGGANQNQGAESTLALLSTQQHARRRAATR